MVYGKILYACKVYGWELPLPKNVLLYIMERMNTFKQALEDRGLSVPAAVRLSGCKYVTAWKHFTGERRVSAEMALVYERTLSIPRWELRPDLWPPPNPAGTHDTASAQGTYPPCAAGGNTWLTGAPGEAGS